MAEYASVGTCELDLKIFGSVSLIFTVLLKSLSNPVETFTDSLFEWMEDSVAASCFPCSSIRSPKLALVALHVIVS
jgi:hypothetical protein